MKSALFWLVTIDIFCGRCAAFHLHHPRHSCAMARTKISASTTPQSETLNFCGKTTDGLDDDVWNPKLLIHWRGEKDAGYSKPFRQLEFQSAFEAQLDDTSSEQAMTFVNALNYSGQEFMPNVNIEHFNEAMQYLLLVKSDNGGELKSSFCRQSVVRAASKCSLVHALYEVIAQSDDLDKLAELAIQDGGFSDMYKGEMNDEITWCFRARNYLTIQGETSEKAAPRGRDKRYGSNARSMGLEERGLKALTPLLIKMGGKVDLLNPQVKIYIFDGLLVNGTPQKILARRIATGPKVGHMFMLQ
jgi:hypothetical protein